MFTITNLDLDNEFNDRLSDLSHPFDSELNILDFYASLIDDNMVNANPFDTESIVNGENFDEDASVPTCSSGDLLTPIAAHGDDLNDYVSERPENQNLPSKVKPQNKNKMSTVTSLDLDNEFNDIGKLSDFYPPPLDNVLNDLVDYASRDNHNMVHSRPFETESIVNGDIVDEDASAPLFPPDGLLPPVAALGDDLDGCAFERTKNQNQHSTPKRENPVQHHIQSYSPTAVSQFQLAIPNTGSQVTKLSSPSTRCGQQASTHTLESNVQQQSQSQFPTVVSLTSLLSAPGDSFGIGSSNPAESEASYSTMSIVDDGGENEKVETKRRKLRHDVIDLTQENDKNNESGQKDEPIDLTYASD